MNAGIVDSELNFNFRLFCKTVSNSASWGFDRFRLFNSRWHTKVQVRRPDGSVVATQSFAPDGAFEHTFSFDLSDNVNKDEYSVYIAGVAFGQVFNQAYAYPTGYSATTGKNAEITYWDFREVNIAFSGTTGRIRFNDNPISKINVPTILLAAEVLFTNCQLGAEDLADAIIALDNSGISNGSFYYTGNLAAPAERALPAYNNLKDVKTWVMNGAVPVDAPAYEAETTSYMNAVAIADDNTVYYASTPQEITGTAIWTAIDNYVKEIRPFYAKFKAIYPLIGDTAFKMKWNLKNPLDTDAAFRLAFFGSGILSATGWKGNNANAYLETFLNQTTHITINSESVGYYIRTSSANGLDGGALSGANKGTTFIIRTNVVAFRNQSGIETTVTLPNITGLIALSRTSQYSYRVQSRDILSTINVPSSAKSVESFHIGKVNGIPESIYMSDREYSFSYISEGLTDAELLAHNTAVENLQSALKRNVV